ncbi:MAG TPA: CheR family methyltransferase [Kofleriaceae bacterium]|nr:CheR family methyltransferase [Kofleriaceae bacterium]
MDPATPEPREQLLRIVVIGAERAAPIAEVVRSLPARPGFALVVTCHGDADLARTLESTRFPVVEARGGHLALEANRVYAVPADCEGRFQRGELIVSAVGEPRTPIDRLLRSLADDLGTAAAAAILTGRGSDGAIGLKRLKEVGGLTVAQLPDGPLAEMPREAIATGVLDLVLPLAEIGPRLVTFAVAPHAADEPGERRGASEGEGLADTLRDILALLRSRSGHDFSSYKRATLYRRVSRRMQVCQTATIGAYHQHLHDHPDELDLLLRDFQISVTNFFRDRAGFEALEATVIPRLFAGKTSADQVRVWVAGCATGEEAYSIGMLLHEHASRLAEAPQLQIFATDIDDNALAAARLGRYPGAIAADVSPERLRRFFTAEHGHFRVGKELRELVLFSPHNVLRDPPFSRLDLVSCRNLLIYLNRDAQDRVLNVFHFGLRADGFLFLGSSESAENTALFAGLDAKHRLFTRRANQTRLAGDSIAAAGRWQSGLLSRPPPRTAERASAGELHHQLVEQYAPPSVLVNEDLDIVHVSERASQLLQVASGEPSRQLLRMIHPGLRADLRTALYAARQSGRGSDVRLVRFEDRGKPRAIELRVRTVAHGDLAPGSLLVMFDEIDPPPGASEAGAPPPASATLESAMGELEAELHRTRDQLRVTVGQYETSLEELKASNEELQAINEELRSATEELETSKEELQSVNEELTLLNHELEHKVDEISHANNDLQNLMTSTDIGVVFLDRGLNIKRFTPRAQDLLNVIASDLGRPLAHLTHRLDADDLPQLAQSVLQTLRTVERKVVSRDGRRYLARLLPYRSLEDRIEGVVLTFVDVSDLRDAIEARQRSEVARQTSEDRLRLTLRGAPMLVVHQDVQLRTLWGYLLGSELAAGSHALRDLFVPGHAERLAEIETQVLRDGDGQSVELDVVAHGQRRTYDFRVERHDGGVGVVGFDLTASKLAEVALVDAEHRKDEILATLAHELRDPLMPLKVALDIATLANGDPAQLEVSRKMMERQVAQLSQLVDDLLDLSRLTQGQVALERAVLDPITVIEAALAATRPVIEQRRHALRVELPDHPSRVLGDAARLTQVVTHLLDNAAKYTPEGGQLQLAVTADEPRQMLRIAVRDHGEGLAADARSRIFDVPGQGREVPGPGREVPGPSSEGSGEPHRGLGIGLKLVRKLVELHHGRVAATSDGPGRGNELVVELPLVTAHD